MGNNRPKYHLKKNDDIRYLPPEQMLANAIVEKAAKDYVYCVKNKKSMECFSEMIKIESFFRSERFKILTKIDGAWLIKKLQAEATKKKRETRGRPRKNET